jgi:hypothetical protein
LPSNTEPSKRILVLRDGLPPSFVHAMWPFAIMLWGIFLFEYNSRHLFDEPKIVNCVTHACIIDNNSYLIFLPLAIIFSIISLCCFRFGHKEIVS